ncbi:rRNA methyltransferase 3, mitochondrial [Toxorhynchites rutilus septentrionalis]|uniref:rRNA methyltransferase 3, mitochondrial n=1 Tax=Toxorhynchites rutilus septentrionalis TaxID=329112 RepID=UPI00247ABB4B|nr:rRNA methyltransferase 3, mitochondrial [Toxorhynchites rutilus septentrionalis]
MQSIKPFGFAVLRVINCGIKRNHACSQISQHKSLISRQCHISPEHHVVEKDAGNSAENRRMKNNSEHLQEDIESNLFDNQQRINFQLGNMKDKVNWLRSSSETRRNRSKQNESREPRFSQLDTDTIGVMGQYNNYREPIELYDNDRKLKYYKLSRKDSLYRDLQLLITSRKRRELKNKIILEGKRLIVDALDAGLSADYLLCNRLCTLDGIRIAKPTKLVELQSHLMQELSGLVTCPGIIGIFNKPQNISEMTVKKGTSYSLPITVVCDNIREPNNLGSVIRSCAAVSVKSIVLLKGCTFPWEPKCLRGGTGGHFRTNIIGPVAINELAKLVPPTASFLLADNKNERENGNFVFCEYDAANYSDMEHMVLVIGGEAHGVSSDVKTFVTNLAGIVGSNQKANYKIHIPLQNGIESFNTASALSVILCEIRRQLKRDNEDSLD